MKRDARRNIPAYMLCYAMVALVFLLTLVTFFIWRVALAEIIYSVDARSYANRAIYMLGMVFLGILLFGVVMVAEPYLRYGVERHRLMYRFWRVTVPLAIFAAVGAVLQYVF